MQVRFAGDVWVLHDPSPPGAFAVALDDGSTVTAEGAVLLLPPSESPELAWWPAPDGTWRAEVHGEERPASDQELVEVRGRMFRIHLPMAADPTVRGDVGLGLHFFVSSDEERVEVEVLGAPGADRLRGRSHLYLLLTLARLRAADVGRRAIDRGWETRDNLAWRLKVDAATINVHLHRIRQDLGKRGDAAANLIEVRPRVGQVRVATDQLRFERLP
jgi:hypothetical protein